MFVFAKYFYGAYIFSSTTFLKINLLTIALWQRLCVAFQTEQSLSHAQLFATPWTVAHQDPLSMEFSRQGYWGGLPFPSPGDLPNPGTEPRSPALQADALTSEPPGKTPWRRKWQPTPVPLPGKFHGQRSLVGYPW